MILFMTISKLKIEGKEQQKYTVFNSISATIACNFSLLIGVVWAKN